MMIGFEGGSGEECQDLGLGLEKGGEGKGWYLLKFLVGGRSA